MKCGIIGLPNIGKSTVFNCISKLKVKSDNFPFCTIEPNISCITVPDNRITNINKIINSKIIIKATITIVDIAGLVKGAHKGAGLGNKFLSNIRETNAIIHVIRCFNNNKILHIEGNIDPIRDKIIIDTELQFKDIEILEKQIKLHTTNVNLHYIYKLISYLNSGGNIRSLSLSTGEKKLIKHLNLLTSKPILYVCNVSDRDAKYGNFYTELIKQKTKKENSKVLILSAKAESEQLNSVDESVIQRLIKAAYSLLNYITYFTIGKKEIRAWPIPHGWTSIQAANMIHTDFKRGFIRAEIIHYDDYIKYQSESKIKELGKLYVEGKNYIINDGDIIKFRINV